jgi:hypothetical protein
MNKVVNVIFSYRFSSQSPLAVLLQFKLGVQRYVFSVGKSKFLRKKVGFMLEILQFVAFSGLWAEGVGWVCWGKNGLWTN